MAVTLYSTGCPMCEVLKSKLDEKDILYNYVDDTQLMINKGFSSAPQLEINGTVYDFNSARKLVDSFDNSVDFVEFVKIQNAE